VCAQVSEHQPCVYEPRGCTVMPWALVVPAVWRDVAVHLARAMLLMSADEVCSCWAGCVLSRRSGVIESVFGVPGMPGQTLPAAIELHVCC
jgi:hypothetical protein